MLSDLGTVVLRRGSATDHAILGEAQVEFDVSQQDVVAQLDAFGTSIEFWAWPAGEPRPLQPLISVTDSLFNRIGGLGLTFSPATTQGSARFRWVQVADAPIAANAMLPGDADSNGVVDLEDFNRLKGSFGSDDPFADFNEDGVVDLADFGILKGNFGGVAAVPEPAGVMLASLSGLGLAAIWGSRKRSRSRIARATLPWTR